MNLQIDKVVLLSNFQPNKLLGVKNKITGIKNALQKKGYDVITMTSFSNSTFKQFIFVKRILFSDAKYFIIRNFDNANIFLLPIFIAARVQGKILILDSPTPMKAAFNENKDSRNKSISKYIKFNILYAINGPWSLWPFNVIIQYGNESWYYKLGNQRKTIMMGNGIDIERIPKRTRNFNLPTDNLKLVGVANVAAYHGFDRVIKAISEWEKINTNQTIDFIIIGVGEEGYFKQLQRLATELKVQNRVHFLGPKIGEELIKYYNESHFGISSLGLFRLNLSISSVLKAREYCLAGIPFIASGKDPDFSDEKLSFRLTVSNDDGTDDLLKIFKEFFISYPYNDDEIHNYAIMNLSYENKIAKMGL